jgi:hypothetical protein
MGKKKGTSLNGPSPKGVRLVMEPVVNVEGRSAEHPIPQKVKKKNKKGKGKKGKGKKDGEE